MYWGMPYPFARTDGLGELLARALRHRAEGHAAHVA
jgi:hypothetical protein